MDRITLTISEVAKLLGIGRSSAYMAVRRGEIPTIKIGGTYLVPRSALDELLAGNTHGEGKGSK
jgi:excisionase family DNA binding protein